MQASRWQKLGAMDEKNGHAGARVERRRPRPAMTTLVLRSFVVHSLKHARMLMVQKVAMKGPPSRIIGVESHNHGCFRRHQHRVAQGADKAIAVDGDDLERNRAYSTWPFWSALCGAAATR